MKLPKKALSRTLLFSFHGIQAITHPTGVPGVCTPLSRHEEFLLTFLTVEDCGILHSEPMPGRVKQLIEEFVELRAGGQDGLKHFVRAHLVLSGVNPSQFSDSTPDDPVIVEKLKKMIAEFDGKRGSGAQ